MALKLANNIIKTSRHNTLVKLKNGINVSQLGINTISKNVYKEAVEHKINLFNVKKSNKILFEHSNNNILYTKLDLYKPSILDIIKKRQINDVNILNTLPKSNINIVFLDSIYMSNCNDIHSMYEILENLKKQKLIEMIGVCVNNPAVAHMFIENSNVDLILLKEFNIFETKEYINIFNIAQKNNVDLIIDNKYNLDFFDIVPDTIYYNYITCHNDYTIIKKEILNILERNNIPVEALLIQYPLHYKSVKSVIVECKHSYNFYPIINNINCDIPLHVWEKIDSILLNK
jgi:hypothetical protein